MVDKNSLCNFRAMRQAGVFRFKKFSVQHDRSTMKVGTDGVLLGAWVNVEHARRILDVGTGSGVIALMLAQRTDNHVTIDALDMAAEDFEQAKENFALSPWHDRLTAYHSLVQQFAPMEKYDCLVINPPFFSNSLEPPDDRRKQVRHTLTLSFYDILSSSSRLLNTTGKLNVILPSTEGEQFIETAASSNFHCSRKTSFRTRPQKPIERLLLEFTRTPVPTVHSEILLYEEGGTHSTGYRTLTRDFYLNF